MTFDLKRWAPGIGITLFLALGLFLFVKNSVKTVWYSAATVKTYSVDGVDGRSMTLVLLPSNFGYFVYTEPDPAFIEAILVRFRGTVATNYFGNVWNIDRSYPQSPLGIRFYGEEVVPVIMEADIIGKFLNGNGTPSFPNEGERMDQILLFSPKMIEFQGMPLSNVPNSTDLTRNLMERLPLPNS